MRARCTRRVGNAAIVAVLASTSVAAIASTAEAAASPDRLYACVTRTFRTLNLTTKAARCPAGQTKISWQVEGPRGKDGPAGDRGAQGPKGDTGAGQQGPSGPQGPAGSPDTPNDVLTKLLQVDGSGSGLDADLFGGLANTAYQRRVTGSCAVGQYVRVIADNGTVTCGQDANSVPVPLVLTQTTTAGSALQASISSASSGSRVIDVSSAGVGPGVFANTPGGTALWGNTNSISQAAVLGDTSQGEVIVGRQSGTGCEAAAGSCNGIGAVVGRNDGRLGYGVRGFVTDPGGGIGVLGQSGVSGGTGAGVRGENVNAGNGGNGVEGVTNGSGSGIFGQGTTAGTFNGNVVINGDLTVTGTKSGFKIDDPRDPTARTLTHTPVETNALTVTYTGNVRTNAAGRATVRLPEYAETLAGDWRYQLTPIGRFGQAIVSREVHGGTFEIRTEHGATKVSWTVTGTRHDPQARRHAIQPEVAKRGHDRGRYLEPALYGAPASRGVTGRLQATAAAKRPRLASDR